MRLPRRARLPVALVVVLASVAACGSDGEPSSARRSGGPLASPDVVRAEGVARVVPQAPPVVATVAGLTRFAGDFYAEVADADDNVVFSPLSIGYAFAMARAGAVGATAEQIDDVFGFPPDVHAAFNALGRELVTAVGPPRRATAQPSPPQLGRPPVVTMANGLFVQRGASVGIDFLTTLARHYGAGVERVDFTTSRAEEVINTWVRRQTADRIDKLFDEIDPSTLVVLANALYLKADWKTPFAEYPSEPAPFTRSDGRRVQATTMHSEDDLRYAESRAWQAVELPYAGEQLSMWVLVPRQGTRLGDVVSPATFAEVASGLRPTRVDLRLPRWDFEAKYDLLAAVGSLGLADVGGFAGIRPDVGLDQAVHRAHITVDESGTEAAAVTGVAVAVSGPPPVQVTVRADHPFAFVIVHRATRSPLFVGHVADPTQG